MYLDVYVATFATANCLPVQRREGPQVLNIHFYQSCVLVTTNELIAIFTGRSLHSFCFYMQA